MTRENVDSSDKLQISQSRGYRRARLLFFPIVAGVTLIFGLFYGIKGAIAGCMYGCIGGLFLIHENLPLKKNTGVWFRDTRKRKSLGERSKKR
jgi:hypothetical protein